MGTAIDKSTLNALEVIATFNDAFNAADLDRVMMLMTHDCVFDTTFPAPDGQRFEGQVAVKSAFAQVFSTRGMRIDVERIFACGEQISQLWRYSWENEDGSRGHVRGVDVIQLRDGKVAEKLSYVKG